jgi:biotin carboxylase/acetyl-CoA carboxylase carboxyltransferase component/biotin carboxyl carrier protein
MGHDLLRIAVLGNGPDAIRVVHAVRELACEGTTALRTIALHDRDDLAFHVREADERAPLAARWDEDLALLHDALVRVRADALWSTASRSLDVELALLCRRLEIVLVGGPPPGARDPATLRHAARDAGWSDGLSGDPGRDAPRRRVAIAVVADRNGRVVAPAVSDITLRRAGEPVLVECPAAGLADGTARALRDAAIRLASRLGLVGVATVEALVAKDSGRFALAGLGPGIAGGHAFEAATGIDLIKLQLQLARGAVLDEDLPRPRGHAFAARITCEDPEHGFTPTAGVVDLYRPPLGLGLRVDPAVVEGDQVDPRQPTLASIVAWGRDRTEALVRLSRGLRETSLIVRGGATNKASLLALCARPELQQPVALDDGWLDRRIASGAWLDDAHVDIALCAVAIDAYCALRAAEAARFFRTAEHGRPRLAATGGHRITLRHGQASYTLMVSQIAPGSYRIEAGPASTCEVRVERSGPHEHLLAIAGGNHRVYAVGSGARHVVEVDGVPRQITVEDALGVVRSPSPAVVLRTPVAPGQAIAAGQPVIVLEAMKMEIVVAAPVACRIREVLVMPSSQVDLDAPLVVYDLVSAEPRARFAQASAGLRRLLLGYDADAAAARAITDTWKLACATLPPTDAELAHAEVEAMAMFADVQSLLRRQPAEPDTTAEPEDAQPASAQEHLFTFLRSLAPGGEALPEAFLAVLRRVVAHYGAAGLDDSPALREALQRIFCAHERADEQALAIAAILDRRLEVGPGAGAVAGDEFHVALNQVIATARRRFPVVHELALEVRHALFDEPMFERTRAAIRARARSYVDDLEGSTSATARAACVEGLIACPQPLLALLVPRLAGAGLAMRAAMLEVLTRRYYRSRGVTDVAVHVAGDTHHVTGCYVSDGDRRPPRDSWSAQPGAGPGRPGEQPPAGRPVTVLATYAAREALPAAVRRLAPLVEAAGHPRDVVVDIYTWSDAPLAAPDAGEREVRAALAAGGLPQGLCRVVVATARTSGGEPIQCVTYRSQGGDYVEDALYRGVHPMIGRRIHIWRLAGFELERLPSVEDVFLYRGIARTNPKDERLFAMGEVRDMTPVRDAAGRIVQLPYLERVLGEALAAIRRVQAARPPRDRLQWNRVGLNLWEPLTLTGAELADVVRRLAPDTEGLGIEQVIVHAAVPDPATGGLRDAALRISNTLDGGLNLRFTDPPAAPIAPLSEYDQKVIALRRRGLIYPYEIVRLLTPPGPGGADGFPRGSFVEYDLDAAGALAPVERPPGHNTANIVAGVLRSYTPDVPEGITRVVLLGDAHKEMGSLAEPECRRILAAIDLAERMAVPLEWFALSAGAKISRQSGTENMDWISAVLRRIIEFTQRRGEINIVVCGINVGAQPYWNAEATMLMHTRGILVMIGDSAMVLTGKQALDYSGSTSADDNQGIGGYERIMGPNGQAQYWATDIGHACRLLLRHYAHTYVVPGERFPRRTTTTDPPTRDVRHAPHPGSELPSVGDVFGARNAERKRPFDIRPVMRAISDLDHEPLERWRDQRDADIAVVWDAHLGGAPVCMIGLESHALPRRGFVPGDGPVQWTSGTLFPRASKKVARAINAASGNRPVIVVANLAGFDGSPESMRELQLEYGAEIGRAVVNFDGPIVFCVVSRYHGGAFVVFSKQLNAELEVLALEGARASVIGGAPAAAVVFARDVDTRTAKDPRLVALERALAEAPPGGKPALRDQLAALRPIVRSEKLGEVADEFDQIHSVQRALQVGSLDRIVPVAALRPQLIEALERGMARTLARWQASGAGRAGA